MTLKEEFKEIAEIMLAYKPNFEVRPNYMMVENYNRPYCNIDGECNENNDEVCSKCIHQKFDNYDLALTVGDYDVITYCFTKSEIGTRILSREDMLNELNRLQSLILNRYVYELEQYHKFDRLKEYAHTFYRTVIDDFNLTLCKDILPIEFCDYWNNDEKAEEQDLGGVFKFTRENCANQHMINIYQCSTPDEDLNQTIRHEIIHYILYVSYLKNDDSDGIFNALCSIYDALPYKAMDCEEQTIYNEFMYIFNNIDDLIQRSNISRGKNDVLNLMLRYLGRMNNVNPAFIDLAEPIYNTLISDYSQLQRNSDQQRIKNEWLKNSLSYMAISSTIGAI